MRADAWGGKSTERLSPPIKKSNTTTKGERIRKRGKEESGSRS